MFSALIFRVQFQIPVTTGRSTIQAHHRRHHMRCRNMELLKRAWRLWTLQAYYPRKLRLNKKTEHDEWKQHNLSFLTKFITLNLNQLTKMNERAILWSLMSNFFFSPLLTNILGNANISCYLTPPNDGKLFSSTSLWLLFLSLLYANNTKRDSKPNWRILMLLNN